MRSFALPCFRVDDLAALVRLDVLGFALGAHIIATTAANVSPLRSIAGATIVIDKLLFGHIPTHAAGRRVL
jgi:hypothetical protein